MDRVLKTVALCLLMLLVLFVATRMIEPFVVARGDRLMFATSVSMTFFVGLGVAIGRAMGGRA